MKQMKRREFLKTTGAAAMAAGCLTVEIGSLHAQETSSSVTKEKVFKPGDKVNTSGIYDVFHDKIDGEHHAKQHQVIVVAGTVFPLCKGCREWVTFQLSQEAEFIDKDPHFET